jgi:Na+-transporting methylmalonyl-CoA/oxaloacetate decarboxylase gamma subunit
MKQSSQYLALLLTICSVALAQETEEIEQTKTVDTGNTEIYNGLVIGIGKGTLSILIFAIAGIVICLIRDSSSTPNLLVAAGIALPLLVLVIIVVLPKRSLKTDKEVNNNVPTDNYLLWKLLITIGMGLVFLALLLVTFGTRLSIEIIAQKMESLDKENEKDGAGDVELQPMQAANPNEKSNGETKPLISGV